MLNIKEVIRKHGLWLRGDSEGIKANLSGVNLSGANLSGANLSGANFSWANLSGANLSGAKLSRARFYRANLYRADLFGANLSGANLSGADLYMADLSKTGVICVRSMGGYDVQIDKEYVRIGCQIHKVGKWKSFSEDELNAMAKNAVVWWARYKKAVFALHESVMGK